MGVPRTRRNDLAILVIVLTIAMLVRVTHLDSSLWYDEIVTLVDFVRSSVGDLLSSDFSSNNHPFYSLQAKASVFLFGESNWSIRFPALVFGVAGIAVMWRLARQITGPLQAHVCALLLALSYHHVWFSQNARGYTGIMFWCVASTLILINCLRSGSWGKWAVYGLFVAGGIYTHLTAAFFFLAQAVIVGALLVARNHAVSSAHSTPEIEGWSMPLFGFLTAGIFTLLAYSPSVGQVFNFVIDVSNTSSVDVMKEHQSPVWAALEIVRSFARPGVTTSIIVLAAALLTAVGGYSIFRKEPLVPTLLVLHVTITLVTLMALSMRIWPRFFFIDIGFVLLFMTQGLYVCCRQMTIFAKASRGLDYGAEKFFVFFSAFAVAVSCAVLVRNYQFPKQDFESSINYITAQKSETDKVVTLGLAAYPYQKYYAMDWPTIESEEDLRETEGEATAAWLVIIFPARTARKYAGIMNYVNENYTLARTFRGTLGDGNILVFTSKPLDQKP